jgi:hypothetical protein
MQVIMVPTLEGGTITLPVTAASTDLQNAVNLFSVVGAKIMNISYGCLLLGLAGYLIHKGRRGILEEDMSVLPRTRIQAETSFVGGRMSSNVKGAAAKRLGSLLIALGVFALAESINFFLKALR